jgi:alcohol dehydrogenase
MDRIVVPGGSSNPREPEADPGDLSAPDAEWQTLFGLSRLVFGAGGLERLGELARDLGASRVLLVSDRGLREAGHVERALGALRAASLETAVYDGVEPDPTTRHVSEGLEVARALGANCIVGLGGGSAMDCAKGVNFLLTNGGRMEDYRGANRASAPMLPSIGVPTTAGTGSEAQSYALIRREEDGVKMACGDRKAVFRSVILDPALCASAPAGAAVAAGIDAIAHAVESHVSTRRNPLSRLFSLEAWRLLGTRFSTLAARGPSETETATWGELLLGAYLAGAAIEQSMLGAAHACANPLTARFPMPHGHAVGILLPHVIRFNAAQVGRSYDELSRALGPEGTPTLLEEQVRQLEGLAGLPDSLRDYQVPRDLLPELAAEAEQQWTAAFNPRPVRRAELLEIYEAAY